VVLANFLAHPNIVECVRGRRRPLGVEAPGRPLSSSPSQLVRNRAAPGVVRRGARGLTRDARTDPTLKKIHSEQMRRLKM
jgi:hypothetical protein